jgi:hypothetical protein
MLIEFSQVTPRTLPVVDTIAQRLFDRLDSFG